MKLLLIKETNNETSQFYYLPNFLNRNEVANILGWLESIDDFSENSSFNNNKVARYQKWFQEEGVYFCPKWENNYKRWEAFLYDKALEKIQKNVLDKLGSYNLDKIGINIPYINSCLVNKYPTGKHYIKPHRDTELSFGKEPVIIGISIGSPRELKFNRLLYNGTNKFLSKKDKQNKHLNFSYKLESGSVFIMSGSSQKYWSHEVPPCIDAGCRYSLTFRHHNA